eukprot:SAG11_NODE_413_length_9694_cov_2.695675_8_plen_67_part_00
MAERRWWGLRSKLTRSGDNGVRGERGSVVGGAGAGHAASAAGDKASEAPAFVREWAKRRIRYGRWH